MRSGCERSQEESQQWRIQTDGTPLGPKTESVRMWQSADVALGSTHGHGKGVETKVVFGLAVIPSVISRIS